MPDIDGEVRHSRLGLLTLVINELHIEVFAGLGAIFNP
jgi:hypothetical protein